MRICSCRKQRTFLPFLLAGAKPQSFCTLFGHDGIHFRYPRRFCDPDVGDRPLGSTTKRSVTRNSVDSPKKRRVIAGTGAKARWAGCPPRSLVDVLQAYRQPIFG